MLAYLYAAEAVWSQKHVYINVSPDSLALHPVIKPLELFLDDMFSVQTIIGCH